MMASPRRRRLGDTTHLRGTNPGFPVHAWRAQNRRQNVVVGPTRTRPSGTGGIGLDALQPMEARGRTNPIMKPTPRRRVTFKAVLLFCEFQDMSLHAVLAKYSLRHDLRSECRSRSMWHKLRVHDILRLDLHRHTDCPICLNTRSDKWVTCSTCMRRMHEGCTASGKCSFCRGSVQTYAPVSFVRDDASFVRDDP